MSTSRDTRSSRHVDDSKWENDSSPSSSRRSLKDDMKQQMREMKSGVKQKAQHYKEQLSDTLDDSESTLYSLRSRVVNAGESVTHKVRDKTADFLEDEVERSLDRVKKSVARTAHKLRDHAPTRRQRDEEEDESEQEDNDEQNEEEAERDEEDDSSSLQRKVKDRGASLLNKASDMTSSLRRRVDEAVPGIEKSIKRGVKQVKEQISKLNEDDDDEDLSPDENSDEGESNIEVSDKLRSGARRAGELLEDAKSTASQKLRGTKELLNDTKSKLKSTFNRVSQGFDWTVDDEEPISPTFDEDEDFDVSIEPIHKGKASRSARRNRNLPLIVIGSLFAIWAALSLYSWFVPPVESLPPSLYDQARQFGHDFAKKTEPIADFIVGRRPEPSLGDRLSKLGSDIKSSIFGRPNPHGLAESVVDGIGRFEDSVYDTVDRVTPSLKHAKDYAESHLIPNARDTLKHSRDQLNRLDLNDYTDSAKEKLYDWSKSAEHTAEDMGLIRKKTFLERAWNWLGGGESRVDEAQRRAGEFAHDMKARMQDGLGSLHHKPTLGERIISHVPSYQPHASEIASDYLKNARDRASELAYEARDHVESKRSIGDRIKGGLESIRSHLPGANKVIVDREDFNEWKHHIEDDLHQLNRDLHNMPLGHRTHSQHPHLPHDDLHGEAHKGTNIHPLDDIKHAADRAASHIPLHKESLGERVRHAVQDGVDAIRSHLPLGKTTEQHIEVPSLNEQNTAIRGLHRASEAVDRKLHNMADDVRSRVDQVRDSASAYGSHLKGEAEDALHHAKKNLEYGAHRTVHNAEKIGHRVSEGAHKAAHRIEENADYAADRLDETYDLAKDKVHYHMP